MGESPYYGLSLLRFVMKAIALGEAPRGRTAVRPYMIAYFFRDSY
ncbi:hypothetical protein [Phormidium yuhuli]|nr:hypothetical protein [Phormidium yuhuli]